MKLLRYTGLAVILGVLLLPVAARAISLNYTAFIGANGTNCSNAGYTSPSTDTRNQGDVLTITFKNEQATPLQIRNFPGGNFTVAGNAEATRTTTTNSTFTYEAWLTDGSCKKSSATVTVNPTPTTPSPPTSTPQSPDTPVTSDQSQPPAATEPVDQTAERSQHGANSNERMIWIALAGLALLLGLFGFLVWRRKQSNRAK